MIKGKDRILLVILDICICIALFADVSSTGNLSMALNGAGVNQLAAFCLFLYVLSHTLFDKNSFIFQQSHREKMAYFLLSVLFSLFMVIGKGQHKEEDLKYLYIAVPIFIGYVIFFYLCISWLTLKADIIRNEKLDIKTGKVTKWLFEDHVTLSAVLAVLICRLPYLIAFFPCSMTWDGGAQICNFYGRELFTNHHPPFMSFFYGAIAWYAQKWNIPNLGMFMIPVIQTALSAFMVVSVMKCFREWKVSYWIRWSSLIYYAAFTVWCIFDVTVIKDSMYYPFTVLFVLQVMKCFSYQEKYFEKISDVIQFVVYAVLLCQIRNNGIFVLIFTFFFLFFAVPKKRKFVYCFMVFVCFGANLLLNEVVYPKAGVINLETKVDTYCIMYQQTANFAKKHMDDVTPEEYAFLDTLFDYEELAKVYNPRLADWVKNCLRIQEGAVEDPTASEFTSMKKDYFRIWFAQFLRHPLTYVETFLECSYGYYYPEETQYIESMGFYEMDRHMFTEGMHPARQMESMSLERFLLEQLSKMQFIPGIGLLYRAGFYTWCVLFAFTVLWVRRNYVSMIAVIPAAVNILVCLISPVNWCVRYVLPTMCMLPILLFLICNKDMDVQIERNEKEEL